MPGLVLCYMPAQGGFRVTSSRMYSDCGWDGFRLQKEDIIEVATHNELVYIETRGDPALPILIQTVEPIVTEVLFLTLKGVRGCDYKLQTKGLVLLPTKPCETLFC